MDRGERSEEGASEGRPGRAVTEQDDRYETERGCEEGNVELLEEESSSDLYFQPGP